MIKLIYEKQTKKISLQFWILSYFAVFVKYKFYKKFLFL